MPLENIKDTIQKQAQEKIVEIEKQAKDKIQEIESSISSEKESLAKEIRQKTELKIKNSKEQAKTALYIEKRNAILDKKRKLLKESKDNVIENLSKLNGSEYERIINSLFKNITPDNADMIVPENKESESRNVLNSKGKNYTIKTDKNLKGGFIIKTDKLEINNSFTEIVNQIFEEKEMEIVELLFN